MLGPNDLCLCCGTIENASFEELVQAAAAGGFKAVSIWARHYEGARAAGLTDRDMRLMLESHDVVISELDPVLTWLPREYQDETSLQRHHYYNEESFYRIADSLGARSINALYRLPDNINTEMAADAFARLCDRAAQHGLKVSLEFLPWSGIPNAKRAIEIVKLAGRPNGGINLDTWHHFRSGGSAEELLALSGGEITATQLNDAAPVAADDLRFESRHGRLLPGEGVVDLVKIIQALDTIACPTPIGVEVFSDELNKLSPVEAACAVGQAMRAVLARARNA